MFDTTGCLFVTPGGQNEHPEAWGDVIEWGALNIGAEANIDPDWVRQRQLMANAGVTSFPWLHVRTTGDLDRLLAKADAWGTRYAGVNIEDVVNDNLSLPAIQSTLERWGGQALIITLAWLQNGQGWGALRGYPFALEYFPYDPEWDHQFDNRDALLYHACEEIGNEAQLSFLYGTYPAGVAIPNGTPPYDLSVAHSFFTGDAIGTTIEQWNVWQHDGATPYITCANGGGELVGVGVVASLEAAWDNWLNSTAKPAAWREDNPGEWSKLQEYWTAQAGTEAPTGINTMTGQMLLNLAEARRYAEGTHA
jgi:hypothetical protein